jgi:hypothetical protein
MLAKQATQAIAAFRQPVTVVVYSSRWQAKEPSFVDWGYSSWNKNQNTLKSMSTHAFAQPVSQFQHPDRLTLPPLTKRTSAAPSKNPFLPVSAAELPRFLCSFSLLINEAHHKQEGKTSNTPTTLISSHFPSTSNK